jgi:hypothetical protein
MLFFLFSHHDSVRAGLGSEFQLSVTGCAEERNSTLKARRVSSKKSPNTHRVLLTPDPYTVKIGLQNEQPTYRVDTMEQQRLETKRN